MAIDEKTFQSTQPLDDEHNPELLDSLIERLKYSLESAHQAELPSDLSVLHGLYERLGGTFCTGAAQAAHAAP